MARAARDIGDTLVIASVADASPKPYRLARIPNNVSYDTVSEQPEVEHNQPLAVPISFHGGYGYSEYDPEIAGAYVSSVQTLLTNESGIIRAPPLQNLITLTGAANPPNYFFETVVNDAGADDGQPVLYIIANEAAEINVYKISLDSGDFGTLLNTKTFSVTPTQPCGQPAEWNDGSNTKWYLGLGDSTNRIQRLTTIVSSTSADTWTASGDADARHLKVVGNRLMRSTNENQVSILPRGSDPLTEANWGDDFFVGDVSANITELGEASGLGYVAKEDGFYEWDLVGEAENVFPEIGKAPRNGQGMKYWHGGFLIPAESGLWWTRTGKPVGPDSNPNNRPNHPSLGDNSYLKHGRWHGLAPYGEHIYGIYLASEDFSTYTLWGGERDDSDPPGWGPIIWNAIGFPSTDHDDFFGAFIAKTAEFTSSETRPCIFYPRANNLLYVFLDKDGSAQSKRGEIDVDTGGHVTSGNIKFGMPRVIKQLQVIEGWAEDMGASQSFRFRVYRDGGSIENVGATITDDGFFQRFWTQDTNDTARSILFDVLWANSGATTDTNGSHLRDIVLRAVALPDTTREWTFLFGVEDEQSKTAKKIRSELEGYVGDLKKYTLPDKDTFNGVMGKPRMLRADEISALTPRNQAPPHYVIAAPVREMSGS